MSVVLFIPKKYCCNFDVAWTAPGISGRRKLPKLWMLSDSDCQVGGCVFESVCYLSITCTLLKHI